MATKKKRQKYDSNQRVDAVRRFYDARKTDPELSGRQFAESMGVDESLFSVWRVRYAHLFGGDSTLRGQLTPERREAVLEVMKKEKTFQQIAKERKMTVPTLQGWTMRYGDQLRSEMGLGPPSVEGESDASQTLASSEAPQPTAAPPLTKRGKKLGRPTNVEMDARKDAWRQQAGLTKVPPEPEGRAPFEQERQQRVFPFAAEPVTREVHPEAGSQSAADFQREITARALRERDAVLTTLEIMMREGRLPGSR
jgi:hypothetical protein